MTFPRLSAENINYTVFTPPEAFGEYLTLFKYREVNQYSLCSLILNQVYLSRPEDFNDPFEVFKEFDGRLSSEGMTAALKREVHESGVLCLCASEKNLAMWSYYGKGLRGFAVGYDLERLLDTLKPVNPNPEECSPRYRYVYKLDYRESHDDVQETKLLGGDLNVKAVEWRKMFATKSTDFQHEDECRIVVPPSPDAVGPNCWSGDGLYQHDPDAITKIVLGELLAPQDEDAIRGIMAGRKVTFLRAKRVKGTFRIELGRCD